MQSISRKSHPRRRQAGLTLIELIVVLTILVALGGLLVPVIGNALTRSHLGTCTANFAEISKMLIRAEAVNGNLGNGWTNPASIMVPAATDPAFTAASLTTEEIAALSEIGMTLFSTPSPLATATGADGEPYNVTFNNDVDSGAAANAPAALTATTTNVAVLTPEGAAGLYLPNANGEKYVFFSIDKTWSLLGTLAPEPPVHFGDTEGALPNEVYSRWGGIFKVGENNSGGTYTALPAAEFQRATVYIGDAFETSDNHSGVYWQEVH